MEEGIKYDSGKLAWHLLPLGLLEGAVRVLMHGAVKYAPDNWKRVGQGRQRYHDALLRHLVAIGAGELEDPDSGLPHIDHVLCNAIFLKYFMGEDE